MLISHKIKATLHEFTPPILWKALKRCFSTRTTAHGAVAEWEYRPEGWKEAEAEPELKGWDVESVLNTYITNWPQFTRHLKGTLPFGVSPEACGHNRTNILFHNVMMTYAYVFALCTRQKTRISMLDWGGNIGHYYLISQAYVSDVDIDYHCKDFPRFIEYGRSLFPEAHFHSDESCLQRQYDFVLASGVLHYEKDWQNRLSKLAQATAEYLFITRLPIVHQASSFVLIQRPYKYGYDTEYLGWCLNRDEFLQCAISHGLRLIREFVVEQLPQIPDVPEDAEHWGFLFYKGSL